MSQKQRPYHVKVVDPRFTLIEDKLDKKWRLKKPRGEFQKELRSHALKATALARPQKMDEYEDQDEYEAGEEWTTPYGFTEMEADVDQPITLDVSLLSPEWLQKNTPDLLDLIDPMTQILFVEDPRDFKKGPQGEVTHEQGSWKNYDTCDYSFEEDNAEWQQLQILMDLCSDVTNTLGLGNDLTKRHKPRFPDDMRVNKHGDLVIGFENPFWDELFETDKRAYLEANYQEPWQKREGFAPRERNPFDNEVDPQIYDVDLAYEKPGNCDGIEGTCLLRKYPKSETPKKKEKPPKGTVPLEISIQVMSSFNSRGERLESWACNREKHFMKKDWAYLSLETRTMEYFIQQELTWEDTFINEHGLHWLKAPKTRLYGEIAKKDRQEIIQLVIADVLNPPPVLITSKPKKAWNRIFTKNTVEVVGFEKQIPLDKPWYFWNGKFGTNWEICDENFEALDAELYHIPAIKDRKVRAVLIDMIKTEIDCGSSNVIVRGYGYTPTGLLQVKIAVEIDLTDAHPDGKYLTMCVSERPGIKYWASKFAVQNLLDHHRRQIKIAHAIQRLFEILGLTKTLLKERGNEVTEYKATSLSYWRAIQNIEKKRKPTEEDLREAKRKLTLKDVRKFFPDAGPQTLADVRRNLSLEDLEDKPLSEEDLQKIEDLKFLMNKYHEEHHTPFKDRTSEEDRKLARLISGLTTLPIGTLINCEICGRTIQDARITLAHDLSKPIEISYRENGKKITEELRFRLGDHHNHEQKLTHRCVRRKYDDDGEFTVLYCDYTDQTMHSMC